MTIGTCAAGGSVASVWLFCTVALLAAEPQTGNIDYSQGCAATACHGSLTSKRLTHGALSQGTCDTCHEAIDGKPHAFAFTEDGGELCYQCHDEFEGDTVHAPVDAGTCTACHDPHGSDHDHLLRTATVGATCLDCHEESFEELESLHGPVAAEACTACHNPHASDHATLLVTEGNGLCATCHEAILERIAGSSQVHPPVLEDCLTCHSPHGGSNRYNLTNAPPDLCLDCHEDLADTIDDAEVKHDAVTTGRACLNCHNPHVATHSTLLREETKALCLSCHDKPLESDGGRTRNMAQHLAENPDHHGPIRDDDCTACHVPHGSAHFRLLVEAYPPEFYTSFEEEKYQLCFECHEIDLVLEPETDELTGFRNGTRNLHYLHVNRKEKGRTCRACHDVHGSQRAKHITESVPFGAWKIPINYQPSDAGGSCQPGCHKRYQYNRDRAVVNIPPPTPQTIHEEKKAPDE